MAVVTVILGGRARTLADEAVAEDINLCDHRARSYRAQFLQHLGVPGWVLIVNKIICGTGADSFGHAIAISIVSDLDGGQSAAGPAHEPMLEVVTERPGKISLAHRAAILVVRGAGDRETVVA